MQATDQAKVRDGEAEVSLRRTARRGRSRMLGARPEVERIRYPVSEAAATHGASVAKETSVPDEAYADWPGDYEPVRLPWPPS